MMKLFDLSGKVAVVTGGNGGIGLGMARGLAQAGATLVVAARNEKKSEGALKELTGLGAACAFVSVDVVNEQSCRALIAATVERFGKLDILVNNAGISIPKQPEDFTHEEWSRVLDTNLTGAFLCCQAAYPELKKNGAGKIINVASAAAILAAPLLTPYAASKAGLVQMGRALATAWAKDNIQVNSVIPGWTETDMTLKARRSRPGLTEAVIARTPAGRWAVPNDYSGIAVFLASAASDWLTGTAIPVDGGLTVNA